MERAAEPVRNLVATPTISPVSDSTTAGLDQQLDALQQLIGFVDEQHEDYIRDEPTDKLLLLTTMRSRNTVLSVFNLLVTDSVEQAQMLCRPVFEDMVVAHWLVMQSNPSFLIDRFFRHQDATLVREYEYVTTEMGLPYPEQPGLAEALTQREALIKDFGR